VHQEYVFKQAALCFSGLAPCLTEPGFVSANGCPAHAPQFLVRNAQSFGHTKPAREFATALKSNAQPATKEFDSMGQAPDAPML
jgi:hypothetical protein